MNIKELISEIRNYTIKTFESIEVWFEKDANLRAYKPVVGWSINQILEHVSLTNHFLLILIDKAANKSLANVHNLILEDELKNYNFHRSKLEEVGQHKSFAWIRPEHMEPKGELSFQEVRVNLKEQLQQCLNVLDRLPNGEGVISKTTMSVNDLGKIDVYEYIYFLAQHGQRHVSQMAKVEQEYFSSSNFLK